MGSYDLSVLVLLGALAIDAAVGWPDWLFRRIGHPVTWIGALIAWLDRTLNLDTMPEPRRRLNGVVALVVLLAVSGGVAIGVQWLALALLPPWAAAALLAVATASLIAQRSLYQHVAAVAAGLERDGLEGGRRAVAMIVGRNPQTLDAGGVGRAAVESLAENFSDGVVAPVFWAAVAGLPGIVLYKAINTADSMIGHRTPRHRAFGWAAARLDDLVNLPASRLTAGVLVVAAAVSRVTGGPGRSVSPVRAWRAVRRDARHHRSPNAGWPEAAMAGALDLALGGPRTYGETAVDDAWMGDGRRDVTAADIRTALRVYVWGCGMLAWVVALLWLTVRVSP